MPAAKKQGSAQRAMGARQSQARQFKTTVKRPKLDQIKVESIVASGVRNLVRRNPVLAGLLFTPLAIGDLAARAGERSRTAQARKQEAIRRAGDAAGKAVARSVSKAPSKPATRSTKSTSRTTARTGGGGGSRKWR